MQKHVNLVDLVKSFPTNIFLQNLASIQKRTSPLKFAHLAEKSGKGSISNLSTKVGKPGRGSPAGEPAGACHRPARRLRSYDRRLVRALKRLSCPCEGSQGRSIARAHPSTSAAPSRQGPFSESITMLMQEAVRAKNIGICTV